VERIFEVCKKEEGNGKIGVNKRGSGFCQRAKAGKLCGADATMLHTSRYPRVSDVQTDKGLPVASAREEGCGGSQEEKPQPPQGGREEIIIINGKNRRIE